MLIAPLTLTGATMGAVLGLKAFAVAIIGGLTSGMGIIVGGIILGIAETTTGFYLSTGYKDVPGLVLLLHRAGRQAGGPVRQDRHQEGLTQTMRPQAASCAAIVGIARAAAVPGRRSTTRTTSTCSRRS